MAIRESIPEDLENAFHREMNYRTRCAWGDNHIKKLNSNGDVLATVKARNEDDDHPITPAIDGYRPHTNPLDASYDGYFQSTGRPLLRAPQIIFQDDFTGTTGSQLDGRTPDTTANNYGKWSDPSNQYQLNASNQLIASGAFTNWHKVNIAVDFSEYIVVSQINIASTANFSHGHIIRFSSLDDFLLVKIDHASSGTVYLQQQRNGALTTLSSSTAWVSSTGNHTLTTHVTKETIEIIVDGALLLISVSRFASAEIKIGPYVQTDYCESFTVYRPVNFYESFADWNNWNLSTYGTLAANASSISGKWGKLAGNTTVPGTPAGYVGTWNNARVLISPVINRSYFQFQLGKNKTVPAWTDFNEVGFIISDDNSITDPGSENDAVLVSIRSNATGTYLRLAEIRSGVETEITTTALDANEYSSNVQVEMDQGNYRVYENKIGLVALQANFMPYNVFVKVYTRSTSSDVLSGYLRDIGLFSERVLRVQGEVGYHDEFEISRGAAWDGSIIPGQISFLTQIIEDGEDAVRLDGTFIWRTMKFNGRSDFGDFILVDRAKLTGDRINWFFRCSPGTELGYGIQLHFNETPKIFKNSFPGQPGIPYQTIIGEGDIADKVGTGDMTITIECLGPFIKVFKDGNLIVEASDTDYTSGYIAMNSFGVVVHKEVTISERGLQQPVTMRIDHGGVHNPSFEEWDEDDGLTDATTENVANGWCGNASASGAISKDATGGVDGNACQKIAITSPAGDLNFLNEILQRNMRFLSGHKYRLSCYIKVNQANDLPLQGYPIFYFAVFNKSNQREMGRFYLIANPTANFLVDDEWHQLSFEVTPELLTSDIDELYLTLRLTTNSPGNTSLNPQEDFDMWVDHVMVEDLTGFINGEYGPPVYVPNPVSYRSLISDREAAADFSTAFAKLPLNKIWREGESKSWGLIDENCDDLFTSRDYTDIYPGDEWRMTPQWLEINLSIPLVTNQILLYSLWSLGIRWFHLTSADSNYLTHPITKVFNGSVGHDSQSKWDQELDEPIEAQYMQVVILDSDTAGDLVAIQQVELYNYVDESERVGQPPDSAPQVSITTTRSGNVNALPDSTQFSLVFNNPDRRYTPRNKFSEIYGYTQKDGLGDIRSNTPIRIAMTLKEIIAAGDTEYAFRDDCLDNGYWWCGDAFVTAFYSAGMLAVSMPSSPPPDVEARTKDITADVSYFRKIKFNVNSVENPFAAKLQWRVGVRTSSDTIPDATWLTEWNDEGAALYEFDMIDDVGITGEQTFAFVIGLQYDGGFPPDFLTWVMFDYFYLENVPVATDQIYETLMLLGTIGMDKNVGGALGISLDGQSKLANIEGVDFTVALDQPTPNDQFDISENQAAEAVMELLCFIGGIPKQDLEFDDTGITFDVVVLKEQTLREQINQIVEAVGGRIYPLQDGRLVYQNEYPYRTWEQSEQADFERGVITDLDKDSIPGQLTIGTVDWLGVNNFNVLPENEVDAWEVEDGESSPRRYISDGKYYVQIPLGSYTTMRHTKKRTFNKTTGFTIEFIADFSEGNIPFDIYGFCDNVVDRDTPFSAWRLKLWRDQLSAGAYVRLSAGGEANINGITGPASGMHSLFVTRADKYRVRLTVKDNDVKLWINNTPHQSGGGVAFQLCAPKLIDWSFYHQGWDDQEGFRDTFIGAFINLKNHVPDKNETGNTNNYIDPNDVWLVNGGFVSQWKHVNPGAPTWDDASSYLELNINGYFLNCEMYLDATTATFGGMRFRYIDANNYYALFFNTTLSGAEPGQMWVTAYWQKIVAGVFTTIETLPAQLVMIGQIQFNIVTGTGSQNALRWKSLAGGGTAWFSFTVNSEQTYQQFYGATKVGFASANNEGNSFDNFAIDASGTYYQWPDEEYVAKVVIGPTPVEHMQNKFYESDKNDSQSKNYAGQTYRNDFWLDQFKYYLNGDVDPVNTGEIESQSHDMTSDIDSFGIFEAELDDVDYKFDFATIDFYVAKSDDDITFDAWESAILGEKIPGVIKQYIKWKAVLTLTDASTWWGFKHWWPALKSVTINWLVSTVGLIDAFRVTHDISEPTSSAVAGQELNAITYSMGNPKANRVPVLVNKWVEQSLTDYAGAGPLWESNDLPQTIGDGDVYEVRAQYPFPSKQDTGINLRHVHVVINATPYTVDDGTIQQVCGNSLVSFTSGQSIGVVTIEGAAAGQTITVVAIDSVFYKQSSDLDGEEHVFVEDVEAQKIAKRVIDSPVLDNAFAMTRSIARTFGNARLDKDKKHQEIVNSISFPIKPSVNLGRHAVVDVPHVGFYEKQVLLSEVQHNGYITTINGAAVDSPELETFDPLSLEPQMYFATHRLENCQSTYIFQMRRLSDSALIDVYDVRQGFAEYKSSANGVWVDTSSDTFYIRTWYDQSGNANDALQATDVNQPVINWNNKDQNYRPAILYSGNECIGVGYDISPGVNPDLTILSMVQPTDVFGNRKIYGHDDGGFDRSLGCDVRASDNFVYFDGVGAIDVTNVRDFLTYIAIHEWQAASTSVWLNDEQFIDDAAVSNGAGAATLIIGDLSSLFLEPWKGYISQFCLYDNVMEDADRNNVRDYINSKYKAY